MRSLGNFAHSHLGGGGGRGGGGPGEAHNVVMQLEVSSTVLEVE